MIVDGGSMNEERTTAAVQRYLDELARDAPSEAVIRALLGRAVARRVLRHVPASAGSKQPRRACRFPGLIANWQGKEVKGER